MTDNAMLRIEDATSEDVPLILKFIRWLAHYERSEDRVTATEEILLKNLFGPKRRAQALIAYNDLEPVAFALYFFSYSTFSGKPNLYLEDIFVRPEFRGSGFGKELFAFLSRRALADDCGRMEWSVLNWNESAIKFYERLGASPVRDWTVFHLEKEEIERLARPDA